MDGVHDLGGREGFGRVRSPYPKFHETWEPRVRALMAFSIRSGLFNVDEFRHAIERISPVDYITSAYFERHVTALATLLVEKGLTSASELSALAEGVFPISSPIGPGRVSVTSPNIFRVGDKVRVKDEFVSGHHRMPGYVRGKTGTIIGVGPLTHFPDAAAHNLKAATEATFDVRFKANDLWHGACDEASNHVQLFQSYLEMG